MENEIQNPKASPYPNLKIQILDTVAGNSLQLYSVSDPQKKFTKMSLWKSIKKGHLRYKRSFIAVYEGKEYYANINLKPLEITKYVKKVEENVDNKKAP